MEQDIRSKENEEQKKLTENAQETAKKGNELNDEEPEKVAGGRRQACVRVSE